MRCSCIVDFIRCKQPPPVEVRGGHHGVHVLVLRVFRRSGRGVVARCTDGEALLTENAFWNVWIT